MTRAAAAFCLVLLLAPMLTDTARIRGRKLPTEQPAALRVRHKGGRPVETAVPVEGGTRAVIEHHLPLLL